MTIQPLPPVECPAEQRPALDPTTAPRPHGRCHTCGTELPITPALTAERLAHDVMASPAFPLRVSAWTADDVARLRAVADELQMLADGAATYTRIGR